jgi:SPP1 family predicted phage head-tail adaptor
VRAGNLRHTLAIERGTNTVNAAGTPQTTWAELATLQAERIECSTEEHARRFGTSTETSYVFKTRYFGGVSIADRIVYQGASFDIKRLAFDDRRRWTEFSILRVGP